MFTFLLLVAAAEPAPPPTFTVVNRMPAFTVVNRIPAAEPAPIREYWGGSWGWMEKGPDGVYRQVSGPAQEVSPKASKKLDGPQIIGVPNAGTYPRPEAGTTSWSATPQRVISIGARGAVPWASTDCVSPYG